MTTYKFDDGKYIVLKAYDGTLAAFRYGQAWPAATESLVGDKLSCAMLNKIDEMRDALTQAEGFIAGFEGDETQEGIFELLTEVRRHT